MKKHLLLFALLVIARPHLAQDINFNSPLVGFTSNYPLVKKAGDGGWVLFENFFKSHEGSLGNTKMTKINASGTVEWEFMPELLPNESFWFSSAEPVADGRVLMTGNYATCTAVFNENIIFMVGADGKLQWSKTLQSADIQPLATFSAFEISTDSDGKTAWLSGSDNLFYYILKMDLSDGKITHVSQPYSRFILAKTLPGTENQLLHIDYTGYLSLYQDTTFQRVIADPNQLGFYIYNVKVYETEPQIAGAASDGSTVLMNLDGDTTLIRGTYAYDFDLRNGTELAVLQYVFVDEGIISGLNTKRELAIYSGTDFSTYTLLELPDFGKSFESTNIFWNGNKVLLTGMHQTGVIDNFQQGFSFFEWGKSNKHSVLMTFDPAQPEVTELPVTDASVSGVKINDQSWWRDADTLFANYFKARDIQVQITNKGNTPLHSFQLCSRSYNPLDAPCYDDVAFSRRYDGLNIAPGESYTVFIPELPLAITNPYLAEPEIDSLCFWLQLPNDQLDTNFWNDCYCINPLKRELPDPDGLRVFPNPVQEQLFISIPEKNARKIDIQICNAVGQVVLDGLATLEGQYYTFDTRPLGAGVYFLRMKGGTIRFVKI